MALPSLDDNRTPSAYEITCAYIPITHRCRALNVYTYTILNDNVRATSVYDANLLHAHNIHGIYIYIYLRMSTLNHPTRANTVNPIELGYDIQNTRPHDYSTYINIIRIIYIHIFIYTYRILLLHGCTKTGIRVYCPSAVR